MGALLFKQGAHNNAWPVRPLLFATLPLMYNMIRSSLFLPIQHGIRVILVVGMLGFAASITGAAQAQERSVGYTFSPTVEWFQGENESGLRSDVLYGGEIGINLGQYLEIGGEAFYGPSFETDFSQLDQLAPIDREVDLLRYGARMRANLRTDGLIPYLSLGTGVMQFDAEGVDQNRTIYTTAGAGITYAISRYRVSLGGDLMGYRYDPAATFLSNDSGVSSEEERVINPSLRAGVTLFLGGRPLDEGTGIDASVREQFGGGLRGMRLSVDPFLGRIEWDDALGMPKDQTLRGVNAGVRLGSVLSVHGFYARGSEGNDLFDEVTSPFESIQMYGGEARVRLVPQPPDRGARISPYVILGGGYLDVMSGYDGDLPADATVPNDRFFAASGVGLDVPIGDNFALTGTVRSVFADAQDPGGTGNTDLQANLMYTVGVSFGLGGNDRRARRTQARAAQRAETAESEGLQARLDSLEQRVEERQLQERIERLERLEQQMTAERDTMIAQRDTTIQAAPRSEAQPARSNLSGQSMTIPVPEVGAVYIRFGEGEPEVRRLQQEDQPAVSPTADAEAIQQAVRDALREQADSEGEDGEQALTDEDVERTVQRALRDLRDQEARDREQETRDQEIRDRPNAPTNDDGARDDTRVNDLRSQLEETRRQMVRQEQELEALRRRLDERPRSASEDSSTRTTPTRTTPAFYRSFFGRPLTSVIPLAGFRAGTGPTQYQIGVRADYRNAPSSRFRFIPEVALASSPSTTSLAITANAAYSFGSDFVQEQTGQPLEPYAGAGLGLASARALRLGIVTNVFVGVEYPLGRGALFGEYSTFNVFDVNRLLFGYRIPL